MARAVPCRGARADDTVSDAWLTAELASDTPGPPLARAGGGLVNDELTVFGGMDDESRQANGVTYVLDLPTM